MTSTWAAGGFEIADQPAYLAGDMLPEAAQTEPPWWCEDCPSPTVCAPARRCALRRQPVISGTGALTPEEAATLEFACGIPLEQSGCTWDELDSMFDRPTLAEVRDAVEAFITQWAMYDTISGDVR